jgi:hypothetical protein
MTMRRRKKRKKRRRKRKRCDIFDEEIGNI